MSAPSVFHVKDLPDSLDAQIADRDLIVFDGVCVLCSRFFQFVLARDHAQRFSFATAQSPLGQELYRALDLPIDDLETNLVIVNGRIYQRLDAVCAVTNQFSLGWRFLALARYLPKLLKDPAYNLVARNRYRLFGRTETCLVPAGPLKSRFIAAGWA